MYEELKQKIQDFDKKMDINDQTEKGLRLDNPNLTTLLDNIPGCIALILKKGNREIVASNKFAKELGAIPGLTCFKTCSLLDNNCPWCLAPKLWETGQSQKIEIENKGKWYEGIWEPLTEDLYVHYIFDITERKLVEEEAKRSELKFKLAMETIKDVFWISTYGIGKMVYISPAYEVLWETDCTNLYMSPKSFLEKIHPEDLNAYQETIEKYHAKGFSYESEYRIVKKNGDIAWIHEKGYPIVKEFDGQKLMTGTCSEITVQKFTQNLAQAQLELSFELGRVDTLENGMNLCLEAALLVSDLDCGGIYLVDKKSGNFDLVFHKGLSKNFVHNTSCFEKGSDNATLVMMGNPIYTKHQQLEVSLNDSEKKENLRAVAILPIKYQNQVIGCLNIASHNKDDIPNLSRIALETISNQIGSSITYLNTQITLRDSEEQFRTFFNQSFQFSILLDKSGMILAINEICHLVYGNLAKGVVGKPIWDADWWSQFPETVNKTKIAIQIAVEGNNSSDEIQFFDENRKIHYGMRTFSPIKDSEGKTRLISLVGMDITKIKKAEQEKIELLTQLQQLQKIESIGNLASGIAHDFNNLLFPIIGMSEMLMEDFPSDSPEYQDANEIFKAGKRGSELVTQILSFSRRYEHKLMPVRVQKIMKEVLKLTRSTIPSSIEIQINIQQDCGMVLADPTQLHQVGMNLITNAYQAIKSASGKINIGLKEVINNKREPLHTSLSPGKYVQLLVADNGIGMAPSVIDKIFEPYFTTKARGKGTGLGLAVVYGIIKEHKGDILVTSHEGKGTSFKVFLPLIQKKGSMNNPSIHEFNLTKGNERLLILDDEKTVVNIISKVLTRLGYKVTGYTNSRKALIKFKSDPDNFDLIISDMTMPEMTGDEFASEILSIRPEVPIIICTGFSERIDKERAESIGVRGFLMKPVLKSEMAHLIRKLLDGSSGNLRT